MPNSNYPELLQDRAIYLENTEYFSERMKEISDLGVNILGGCCGTTPEYTKALKKKAGEGRRGLHSLHHFPIIIRYK